jgi:hypothetical protein
MVTKLQFKAKKVARVQGTWTTLLQVSPVKIEKGYATCVTGNDIAYADMIIAFAYKICLGMVNAKQLPRGDACLA